MSKLDELIRELCPDGVPYKKLIDVCDYVDYRGKTPKKVESGIFLVTAKNIRKGYIDYESSKEYIALDDFDNVMRRGTAKIGDILITTEAPCGNVALVDKEDIALAQRVIKYRCNDEINPRFLLHILLGKEFQNKLAKASTGGTVKGIKGSKLHLLEVPVPPLEVQEEIVRLLDDFTAKTAELQNKINEELEARKKQYEFYRDSFFSDKLNDLSLELCSDGVKYKNLEDLGSFYGGLTGKSKDDFENGNKIFITYKNVYSNPSLDLHPIERVKIGESENQRTLEYGDVIFTGSSETPDECGISSVVTEIPQDDLYLNSFCFIFRFNNLNEIYPPFMKHLFRSSSIRKQISRTANGVTRYNVSKKLMAKISIPLPPMKVQQEIVHLLDDFTAKTTKLQDNLNEELEACKKQYEFYRDKLLTFKELNESEVN